MPHTKIFETVDNLTPAYIDIWQDVCNIESPTDYKEGDGRLNI